MTNIIEQALTEPRGGTVHITDSLSEPVFGVLGPATELLHELGVPQTVVLVDRPEHSHRLPRFARGVRLVPVAPTPRRWNLGLALRRAVREQLRSQQPSTVHYHGRLAWLSSLGLAHNARVLASPLHSATAARLEAVVDDVFLHAERREARRPLVVSGCHRDNRAAVELLCRAAVIFGAAELKLQFHWCGPVSRASRARLDAVGIGAAPVPAADDLLPHLQSGWVFLAGGGEREMPLRLAQAMACGVPCLAADRPAYRDLIEDGHTGLLFRTDEEARQLLTLLIDDARLRRSLGSAARRVAWQRFSRERLRANVLSLYGDAAAAVDPVAPETVSG